MMARFLFPPRASSPLTESSPHRLLSLSCHVILPLLISYTSAAYPSFGSLAPCYPSMLGHFSLLKPSNKLFLSLKDHTSLSLVSPLEISLHFFVFISPSLSPSYLSSLREPCQRLPSLILVCNRGFSLSCISDGFSIVVSILSPCLFMLPVIAYRAVSFSSVSLVNTRRAFLCRATQPMFPLHNPCFFLYVANLVSATQALSLCCCLGIGLSRSIYAQPVFSSPLKPNLFL
ncbi:unnamed protein product [Prunus armeniaca]